MEKRFNARKFLLHVKCKYLIATVMKNFIISDITPRSLLKDISEAYVASIFRVEIIAKQITSRALLSDTPVHFVTRSVVVKVKLSLCLINQLPRHEDVWRSWGVTPSFLTSTLDGCEWSAVRLGRFTLRRKSPLFPLDRRLGGSQSQSGRCEGEKNLLHLPEVELRPSSP
jgi:hypothetical protein